LKLADVLEVVEKVPQYFGNKNILIKTRFILERNSKYKSCRQILDTFFSINSKNGEMLL
jgi:alpha-L-fucosidase